MMSKFIKNARIQALMLLFVLFTLIFALFITVHACSGGKDIDIPEASLTGFISGINEPTIPPKVSSEPCEADSIDTSESSWVPDRSDVEYIAKTLYGECRGVSSETEKAAVAWCILNRVDASGYACGRNIEYVVTFPGQFCGYSPDHPVIPSLENLAIDVLIRWHKEKSGVVNVGRVLPSEYCFFVGDGKHNYFTVEYLGEDYWDYSMESPYDS